MEGVNGLFNKAKTYTDSRGITTFTYNAYGELSTEANLRTLTRNYDNYGRNVGWSLNGSRKNIIEYDGATGRLYRMKAGGAWFTWSYLAGSNLKSQLTYGGSGNTTWEYETSRDLLTKVTNTIYGAVASQYDYVNDLGGRRTQIAKSGTMMAEDEVQDYGYNTRDELISGQGQTYAYDDIGNRTVAEGKTYVANNLNQYTAIDTFEPQYDADGNQTLIKTSTGIWSVTYNAENRPVRWESGDVIVTMDFDRMGRRVFYKEEVAGVVTKHHKFVYDNYLCIQKVDALNSNTQINLFVWDPTESIATRPLFTQRGTGYKFFYTHDGNKNVSELVHFEQRNGIAAHYDYAPFGAVTRAISASAVTDNTFTTDNPFRFSSEYHDDTLGLVYYNYRHYNPIDGRWCGRDLLESESEYLFLKQAFLRVDLLGLVDSEEVKIYMNQEYAVPKNNNLSILCSLPGFAVCNRGRDINPKSISENKEYCGLVCKRCDPISKTMVYTTTVTSGIETSCRPLSAPCQKGWDAVAIWHTHGGNSPKYCNEDFSPRDKVVAMANHLPIYLITPTNQFKIYLPDSDTIIDFGKIYK